MSTSSECVHAYVESVSLRERKHKAEQHEEQDGLEARSLCDPANTASQKRKHCPRDSAREPFMSNPGGYGKRGWNDGGGGPGKRRRPAEAEDGEIEEGEMQEMPHGRGGRGVCPPLTLRCAAAPHPRVAALDFFAPVASILAHLILSLFSARSQAHHPEAARRRPPRSRPPG